MNTYQPSNILPELNILYVEDEQNIRENITDTLFRLVGSVSSCENFDKAKEILDKKHIDIFILDITINDTSKTLQYKDGLEFAKYINEKYSNSQIIIISAHYNKEYLMKSIKLSISDYLLKPIGYKDIKEALLKCAKNILDSAKYITIFPNNYIFNRQKQYVQTDTKQIVHLTSNEIKLLNYLIDNNNIVVSKEMLLNHIWNDEFIEGAHLKVLVNKLRSKIGKNSIITLSGLGYRIALKN